jgi:uncharacterized protein (DUF2235 family)
MTRRLVVCFDGTWNTPAENATAFGAVETNIIRFYESVLQGPMPNGDFQNRWYDTGLGTNWYDQVSGGAFGYGLDQKIRQGYAYLVEHFLAAEVGQQDIDLYILGFSRGAYTGRSLVGLIHKAGLLKPEFIHRLDDAYALYRDRDHTVYSEQATLFRSKYSREIKIKFLGVWDTVGALGIPLAAFHWLNAETYGFLDTELSDIVENGFHAMAIDEHRVDYQATLWKVINKIGQKIEQRWFIGAHADVGGGYATRLLSDISLAWMQAKARETGLQLDPSFIPLVKDENWSAPVSDSYREFLNGMYALTHQRYFRPMDLSDTSNQTMEEVVLNRCRKDPTYRPANKIFPKF